MIECQVEETLPFLSEGAYTTVRDRASAACNSAILLESEGYNGPEECVDDIREEVHKELCSFAEGRESSLASLARTPSGAIYVQSILHQYDHEAVASAQQLRTYITNKLVIETECVDPRVRLKALELLGKITDVGLFTERSEVTVNQRSTQELSDTLKEKLKRLIQTKDVEDAVIIKPPITLDAPPSADFDL